MVANGVTAYFHGHDHQFVHEERDGIVYQEVPSASMTGYGFDLYDDSPYVQTTPPYGLGNLPNAGHLRVTVTPTETTVEYVRSAISGDDVTNGEVSYSYTMEAPGLDTTAPYTSGHSPADAATGVPIDTNIVVESNYCNSVNGICPLLKPVKHVGVFIIWHRT